MKPSTGWYQAKLAVRVARTAATGKKPPGRPPQPPVEGPLPTDQINLTDEESRIMKMPGGGGGMLSAGACLLCASRPRNQCSASSNPSWASGSFYCVGLTLSAASGAMVTTAWNIKWMFVLVAAQ